MEENLKKLRAELDNVDNNVGWNSFYQTIKNESANHEFTCTEARNPANKHLNRYRDVSPYDHSRVILHNGTCNYINASLLKVPKAGRNYILTQGALEVTAGHFWLMVWEQKSKAVLMLNKVIEKNQIKCHQYWPVGGGRDEKSNIMEFSDVNLRVHLLSEDESRHFVIRTLRIEEIGTENYSDVLQFHYTTWPDFGVPSTARTFLHFLQAVRDSGALNYNVGPPVVHCSAGIGRSGTFCLVDTCLLMMEQGLPVDIKEILLDMRKYRMGLIQTADQLRFSYLAILEGVQQLADGNTRFLEDNSEESWAPPDVIPRPPPRITSLTATQGQFEEFIKSQNLMENLRSVTDRPLPELPSSSSSEEEDSSEDDILDEDEESESYGLFEGVKDNTPSESASISEISTEAKAEVNSTNKREVSKESFIEHERTNGVDDATVRRRLKNDSIMEKIREIKTKQKETERSPEPKRRKRSEDSSTEQKNE